MKDSNSAEILENICFGFFGGKLFQKNKLLIFILKNRHSLLDDLVYWSVHEP